MRDSDSHDHETMHCPRDSEHVTASVEHDAFAPSTCMSAFTAETMPKMVHIHEILHTNAGQQTYQVVVGQSKGTSFTGGRQRVQIHGSLPYRSRLRKKKQTQRQVQGVHSMQLRDSNSYCTASGEKLRSYHVNVPPS